MFCKHLHLKWYSISIIFQWKKNIFLLHFAFYAVFIVKRLLVHLCGSRGNVKKIVGLTLLWQDSSNFEMLDQVVVVFCSDSRLKALSTAEKCKLPAFTLHNMSVCACHTALLSSKLFREMYLAPGYALSIIYYCYSVSCQGSTETIIN